MNTRWAQVRAWLLRIAVLGLVAMFARRVPWPEVWSSMRAASLPMLALAFAANYVAFAARTVLWWRLLCTVGVTSLGLAFRAMIVGMALHSVLVGNAGEAGRVLLVMRRSGASAPTVIASVVLERLAVSAGFLAVLVLAGVLLPLPPQLDRWRIPAVAVVGVGALLLALLVRGHDAPRSEGVGPPSGAVRRGLTVFRSSIRQAAAGGDGAIIVALTAVNWICQLATFHWTARAMGLPISIGGSVIAMLTVLASGSIRATPGNLGVTQLAYVATAGMLGVSGELALGVALLLQAIQTIPVVVAGLFVLPDLGTATRSRQRPDRPPPLTAQVPTVCNRFGRAR